SGVGCSINCRCEGCKNAFGRKDVSSSRKKMKMKTPTKVDTFGFKRIGTETSEVELLKERMAKLLRREDMSGSGKDSFREDGDKWWLPLCHTTRDFTNQILKACMSINSIALAEWKFHKHTMKLFQKNGRPCLGDFLFINITLDNFSADYLLESIDLSSQHAVVEMANRVEASISTGARPSWGMIVKEMNQTVTPSKLNQYIIT
ncbi:hypothetical protein HID58_056083, partial [Brassica napus]